MQTQSRVKTEEIGKASDSGPADKYRTGSLAAAYPYENTDISSRVSAFWLVLMSGLEGICQSGSHMSACQEVSQWSMC